MQVQKFGAHSSAQCAGPFPLGGPAIRSKGAARRAASLPCQASSSDPLLLRVARGEGTREILAC